MIFDTKAGKWIENPCYNDLNENNLLYMANASTVLNYDGKPLLADGSYQLKPQAEQPRKIRSQENWLPYVYRYKPEFVNNYCTIATEEMLFDVGGKAGYPWVQEREILSKKAN